MFKRPHLRAAKRLVNAPSALILLFLAAACNPGQEPVDPEPLEPPVESVESTEPGGLTLPAVWQTNDLGSPIESIGVAGGLGSTVAVAFADGGLQFLDLEGERITDKADMGVSHIADGQFMRLQDTSVTVFPGITNDGALSLYIYGGVLEAPLPYPLDAGTTEAILGLCSGGPTFDRDGVMRIGFWTEDAPQELKPGRAVEGGESLSPLRAEPAMAAGAIEKVMERMDVDRAKAEKMLVANNPMRRMITCDEVVAAVRFLASAEASMINGHDLVVSGGEI